MKKLLLLVVMICCVMTASNAASVSQQQARQKAAAFFQKKGKDVEAAPVKIQKLRAMGTTESSVPSFYVFNARQNEGFVIISGDDTTEEVLGYSEQGSFDEDRLPENFSGWLTSVEEQIRLIREGKAVAAPWKNIESHADVSTRMKTKWNQGVPYNNSCPMDGGERCITGCVATAVAQVMNYHRWPQAATGTLDGYTTNTKGISVPALPSVTFDWNNMLNSYAYEYNNAQANAVATLMRYCGQGSLMDYTSRESGASYWNSVNALKNCFGYDSDMRHIFANSYSMEEWESMVYDELTTNGPVCYAGNSGSAGHAFVIDGYRGYDKMYYVNWGWGGSCDGYYKLFVMNPSSLGIGGGNSTEGFRLNQEMIRGFKPEDGVDESSLLQVKPCLYGRDDVLDVTFQNGQRAVTFYMTNKSEKDVNYSISLGRILDDQSLLAMSESEGSFGSGGTYWYYWLLDDWLANYFKGQTLKLTFISKLPDSQEWLPFAGLDTYIEAVVSIDGEVNYTVHKTVAQDAIDLKAYDFVLADSVKQYERQSIYFTVGKCSIDFRGSVYIFTDNAGGQYIMCGETYAALMAGEEQMVKAELTLNRVGTHRLSVATDREGTNVIGNYMLKVAEGVQEKGFYLIGDLNEWSTTDKSNPFTLSEDKRSWRIVFTGPTTNDQYYKVAPASAYDNQDSFWSRLWCVAQDGTMASEGNLVVGNLGALRIASTGTAKDYILRIVPEEMTYKLQLYDANAIEDIDRGSGNIRTVVYALDGHQVKVVNGDDVDSALKQLPRGLYIIQDGKNHVKVRR